MKELLKQHFQNVQSAMNGRLAKGSSKNLGSYVIKMLEYAIISGWDTLSF